MTTIAQLPPATSVNAGDLLPLSQAGLLYSVSVAELTANSQAVINVPTGVLLGRYSIGPGGPESIAAGTGLVMSAGTLAATGGDHAGFPVQSAMSLSDEIVISASGAPGLLPVTALRGLFSAGTGIAINASGVITVTATSLTGPAGPQGPSGPAGPAGPAGAVGPAGPGLGGPTAGNSVSSVGASDYVALWQNGTLAWMPYGQFLGGQTIDQLPAAGPAADSDELLVAQGGNMLSMQSFGAIWTYVQNKLPVVKQVVVELLGNTALDAARHNNRILVASAPITLFANFANLGAGFSCTIINLAPGAVTMGAGITSGSGNRVLPPGAAAELFGLSYSGGSLVWWSGVVPNAPALTVGPISAPAPSMAFVISGGVFNDAPLALDYSINGGASWIAAPSPVITANAYSFTAAGLSPGTYAIQVRDHGNVAVVGVSNSFVVVTPGITMAPPPSTVAAGAMITLSGTVSPANAAVVVGLSSSAAAAPGAWVNAVVSNGGWTANLMPTLAGTYYIWAKNAVADLSTVSAAVTVG